MLFTQSVKNKFAEVFYDKTISILSNTQTTDAEGGIVRNSSSASSTFNGNVRFTQLKELQEELGLVKNIDIAISCPTTTSVNINDILEFNSVKYIVTECLPYDSHTLITGEKWAK